jgi:tRNA dimethylallyltransferase
MPAVDSILAKPTVLFVVGPTASGKTAAALAIVEALAACGRGSEIVNADSRQVYRGMSIGTAKPTPDELARAPHHLIDVADPADGFSLATFLRLSRGAVTDILERGSTPIVVGGTGQYAWGLAEGWQAPEVPPSPEIRARLEAEAASTGVDSLFARLQTTDPEAAALMDPRNVRRIVRALEVIEITGLPFSEQRKKEPPPFAPRMLALKLTREDLYARIDARVNAMLAGGWLAEVEALLAAGNTPDLPAFSSAGYREIAAHLAGELTLEEVAAKAKTSTHRLARTQANWFSASDERISWHETQEGLVAEAVPACCP